MERVLAHLVVILFGGSGRWRRREGGAALPDVMDVAAVRARRMVAADHRRPVISRRGALGGQVVEEAVEAERRGRGRALGVGEVGEDVGDGGIVAALSPVEDLAEVVVVLE